MPLFETELQILSLKSSAMLRAPKAFLVVVICVLCYGPAINTAFIEQASDYIEDISDELTEFKSYRELVKPENPQMWDVPEEGPVISVMSAVTNGTQNPASNEPLPRDCADLYDQGHRVSRDYTIYIGRKRHPVKVHCDMTTNGGGWTVIQRRLNGHTNFYLPWIYYVNGFGSVTDEYWIGLVNLHLLTLHHKYTLRVDLTDFSSGRKYAEYTDFKVGSPQEQYRLLSVGAYYGDAGDSLSYQVNARFSTLDADHDNHGSIHCATHHKGAWWYNACTHSNLNGVYLRGSYSSAADGVVWSSWRGYQYSLQTTEMKIRPAGFNM